MAAATHDYPRTEWGIVDAAYFRFNVEPVEVSSGNHPVLLPASRCSSNSPTNRSKCEDELRTDSMPKTTVMDENEIEAESIDN